MVARRLLAPALGLALSSTLACGQDEVEVEVEPPIEGVALYEVHPGLCGERCWSYSLYRINGAQGEILELRAHELGEYVGRAQADLKPETLAELDALTAEVLAGLEAGKIDPARPECPWLDGSVHFMFVGEYELVYELDCSPPGTEALDELLASMTYDLVGCDVTPRLSPKIGCEPLDPFAELDE